MTIYLHGGTKMQNYLAVFRARTQTLIFANLLNSYHVPTTIINTPRNINVSCGISVKFAIQYKKIADDIMARRKFDSFAGFYLV